MDIFYVAVLTQLFYLVWNAKSIILWAPSDRKRLFADSDVGTNPIQHESDSLPKITAILAARNESEAVLRRSLLSLLSLDYPPEKKEILLVTDSDDIDTCATAEKLSRELGLTNIVVPDNGDPAWTQLIQEARARGAKWACNGVELSPTKPRALIFALSKATGQIITVVDAEDVQGDPEVFRKAAQCIQVKGYDAVQGRLRFINYRDSWLSLQSIGDYAYWFGWALPRIRRLGLPVPFGGTCYYIRREVLDSLGGWDPTNITEDLELGLRVYGYGYHVGIIDVDTYEESPRKLLRNLYEGGWANQRTRWARGMIYTVTRLRDYWAEFSLRRRFAIASLLSYYLLALAVPFISILGYPFMVISAFAALLMQMGYTSQFEQFSRNPLLAMFMQNKWLAALGTINIFLLLWTIFLTIRGIDGTVGKAIKGVQAKIYYYGLAALTIMLYWLLWGLPVLRAIWQIVHRARFWEKTYHEGLHHPVLGEMRTPLGG